YSQSFPATVSFDEDGGAIDDIFLGSLIGRRRKRPRAADGLLGRSVEQLITTAINFVTQHPATGVDGNFIGDITLALKVIGIALVPRRRLVYRSFRTLETCGDPALDRIGIAGGHRPPSGRNLAFHGRGGRRCPVLVIAERMHWRPAALRG